MHEAIRRLRPFAPHLRPFLELWRETGIPLEFVAQAFFHGHSAADLEAFEVITRCHKRLFRRSAA